MKLKKFPLVSAVLLSAAAFTVAHAQTVTNYSTVVTTSTLNGVTTSRTNEVPVSVTTTNPFNTPIGTVMAQQASTATPAPAPASVTPQSFFATVESYVTSFDTNSQTFGTNSPWEIGAGASYQQGLNLGGTAFIEWKPFGGKGFVVGDVSTFAGVVGTVAQQEVDLGYAFRHYDLELTFGALGIDTFHPLGNGVPAGLKGGVFLEAKKALTQNTFLGVKVQDQWGAKGTGAQPVATLFTGFTF